MKLFGVNASGTGDCMSGIATRFRSVYGCLCVVTTADVIRLPADLVAVAMIAGVRMVTGSLRHEYDCRRPVLPVSWIVSTVKEYLSVGGIGLPR